MAIPQAGPGTADPAEVLLFWIPLGAGGTAGGVRGSGRLYEAVCALRERRPRCNLYHSALEVRTGRGRVVVEMAPVWQGPAGAVSTTGAVATGAVGLPRLGRLRAFRYEVRCWPDGVVPDIAAAVGGARRIDTDETRARRLLDLVPRVPTPTWGRDELGTGEMWNSNSVIAWLLAASGHRADLAPPPGGRAPGWSAGTAVAARRGHGVSQGVSQGVRTAAPS
jgi:hypothetical protein